MFGTNILISLRAATIYDDRIFIQNRSFTNAIEKLKHKQKFISSIEYRNEYLMYITVNFELSRKWIFIA